MPKVMIVDDERTTTSLLTTLLEMDGFDVVVVPKGSQVLKEARRTKPDVFLIDYHLADMDGVEVIKALRSDREFSKTPIVVASGLDVEEECRRAGADEFLIKPFDPGGLAGIFSRLIGN